MKVEANMQSFRSCLQQSGKRGPMADLEDNVQSLSSLDFCLWKEMEMQSFESVQKNEKPV